MENNITFDCLHCPPPDETVMEVEVVSPRSSLLGAVEDRRCDAPYPKAMTCQSAEGGVLEDGRPGDIDYSTDLVDAESLNTTSSRAAETREDFSLSHVPSMQMSIQAMEDVAMEDVMQSEVECRICKEPNGHLISPCLCGGTMAKVHASCLQHWLNTRQISQATSTAEHARVKYRCEVCHAPYQLNIRNEMILKWATLCGRPACAFYFEFSVIALCLASLIYIFLLSRTSGNRETGRSASLTWDFTSPIFIFALVVALSVTGFSIITMAKIFKQWRMSISHTVIAFGDREPQVRVVEMTGDENIV